MIDSKPAYFISDLHLGARYPGARPEREAELIRFLRTRARLASHLFIVGDLFEFWMEYRNYIPKEFIRTLTALQELVDHGVEVHYLSGNHDFNLGNFFSERLGIRTHHAPLEIALQGRKLLLLHGDGLAHSDWKYRWMKSVLVHPLANRCFHWIHPDVGMALAHALSGFSRDRHGNQPRKLDEYEAASRSLLAKSGVDILMHGHTHAAFVKSVPEGIYVNSGEWLYKMEFIAMRDGICRVEGLKDA